MATWLAAIVAVLTVTGCKYGADSFACTGNASCGAGGTCQPNNLCSFPDATCPSGQRYGDIAGTQSGQCVDQLPIDASIDMPPPPDGRACFGSDPFAICLAKTPDMPFPVSSDMKIDTTSSSMCAATISGGTGYCVIAATTISITAKLRAIGSKPLVLLASDTITISTANGQIDLASHRGDADTAAGSNPTALCMAGTPPGTRAGGAGGSFFGKGGKGGGAGGAGGGNGGQAANGVATVNQVRGGCTGQDGDGGGKGPGGRGGGAVYLLAGTRIDIGGAGIKAAGEGGTQGSPNVGVSSGGGGGGAGGMILLDAPTVTCSTLLLANGGGGGEGSGENNPGGPGSDPSDTGSASGGSGNIVGGNGGAGSAGPAAGVGGDANAGGSQGNDDGGGGGGGGGAGYIKAPANATLGTLVSPLPSS